MCEAACPASADTHDTTEPDAIERPTIGDIFRQYEPAYRAKYGRRMTRDQRRVLATLAACGTGELGHVHYRCAACGQRHVVPRSCGNRHCPRCQGQKARQWLDTQLERLLPCPYFLVTFTVPQELRRFVRSHPRECYKALFDASSATLFELAKNPKHVGSSQFGFTGVLHTWGRALDYHPHVHYVVPDGAIGPDGQSWLPSRADFFVPVRAASKVFRAKFRDAMQEQGLLPEIPAEVWTKAWIVHSQAVGDGRQSLRYLAPYVFRVAIGNRRIVKREPGPGSGSVSRSPRSESVPDPLADPESPALRLRTSAAQDRSRVAADAGHGDAEPGVRADGGRAANAREAAAALSRLWRAARVPGVPAAAGAELPARPLRYQLIVEA